MNQEHVSVFDAMTTRQKEYLEYYEMCKTDTDNAVELIISLGRNLSLCQNSNEVFMKMHNEMAHKIWVLEGGNKCSISIHG